MADIKQFEEIAVPYTDAVYRAAIALTGGNRERAEDLVQVTFLKAMERFRSFEAGTNIRAWLLRILRNTWIDELRHRRVAGPEVPVDEHLLGSPEVNPETAWSNAEDLLDNFADHEVIEALSELPEDQRMTLYLSDVEGLSQEDVAEVMDVPVGTVKSRTFRARAALKERLEAYARDLGFLGRME